MDDMMGMGGKQPGMQKLGGYLDEFSKPRNPWHLIPTYGVVDAAGDVSQTKHLFETFGIVKVRGAYEEAGRLRLLSLIKDISGMQDIDYIKVMSRQKKPFSGGSPTLTDPRFWGSVTHPNIMKIVRNVLPNGPVTEIGTSVGAHYSARGLHRDFPAWFHPTETPYNLDNGTGTVLRILVYPNQAGRPGGTFGWVPFSHRKALYDVQAKRVGIKRPFEWYDEHRKLVSEGLKTGNTAEAEEMDRLINWVSLDAGDALLLDARIQHGGDYVTGPRYFFVMSFAYEDEKGLGQLRARFRAPLKSHEVDYFAYLSENGLCSESLLAEARAAARKQKAA